MQYRRLVLVNASQLEAKNPDYRGIAYTYSYEFPKVMALPELVIFYFPYILCEFRFTWISNT